MIVGGHGANEGRYLPIVLKVLLKKIHFLINNDIKKSDREENITPPISDMSDKNESNGEVFVSNINLKQNFQNQFSSIKNNPNIFDMFDFIDLVFIPIVNIDGFTNVFTNLKKINSQKEHTLKNYNEEQQCESN